MSTIIQHQGATNLAPEIVERQGKKYPFLFTAVTPEEKRWSYRLLPPVHPDEMSEAELTEIFRRVRQGLRADWEEQVGHPVGFITLYLPPVNGKSETRRGRFDQGPDLGLDLGGPAPKKVPPRFDPPGQDFGMSF